MKGIRITRLVRHNNNNNDINKMQSEMADFVPVPSPVELDDPTKHARRL